MIHSNADKLIVKYVHWLIFVSETETHVIKQRFYVNILGLLEVIEEGVTLKLIFTEVEH